MIPLNLMNTHRRAHFVNTGMWSKKAIAEAGKFGEAHVVASSEDETFSYIPKLTPDLFTPDADYVHIVTNNTIYGTRYHEAPDVNGLTLVSDMSSCILSEEIDVNQYGVIFAGAQKNIGPAGVTITIIRKDLIGKAREGTPTMLDFKTHADAHSLYNTPPTYAIYIAGLVFEWLLENGGVKEMQKRNEEKAKILYDFLDESELFRGTAKKQDRSLMNVPFVTGDAELDAAFIKEAEANGLVNLKGHRSVGGMRASIYNAFPAEGVCKLVEFMKEFEAKNRK